MDPYFQQQKTPEECKLNSYLGKAKFIDRFLSLENEVAQATTLLGLQSFNFRKPETVYNNGNHVLTIEFTLFFYDYEYKKRTPYNLAFQTFQGFIAIIGTQIEKNF